MDWYHCSCVEDLECGHTCTAQTSACFELENNIEQGYFFQKVGKLKFK